MDSNAGMALEEKRTWLMLLVTVGAYAVYLAQLLGRASDVPLEEVSYVSTLIATVVGSIVAMIVLHIVVAVLSRGEAEKTDLRDKQIYRFGEYIGQTFVVVGSMLALGMAMVELAHFWIANTIYLAFVLATILSSLAKIVAYRRSFQPW